MIVFLLLGVSTLKTGMALEKPVIRVAPSSSGANQGQTFTVNITVTGVVESQSLYGWSVWISFNPQIINVDTATEGPFLDTSGYETLWLTPDMNNTSGKVKIGGLLRPTETGFPPNGAVGDGVLVSITFKAVGSGTSSLHFDFTELYTIVGGTEAQIEHDVEDGSFSNSSEFPLQLIASVLVVIVVGSGVAFFLYRRRKGAQGLEESS